MDNKNDQQKKQRIGTISTKYWRTFTIMVPTQTLVLRWIKVSKGAKIRNRYNQVPHLTQDTNWKVTNSQLDTTNKTQEVIPFPASDHKAHINRRAQRHSKRKTEKTYKIHKRSTVLERSVKYFTGGLKQVLGRANLTLNSDVDQDRHIFGLHERPLTYQCIIS